MLAIGYCLKATAKLGVEDRSLLKKLGFKLPIIPPSKFGSALQVDSVQNNQISELRSELNSATPLLSSDLPVVAQAAADACTTAFQQVENAAWNAYQDSMLSYSQPCEPQLDLLEVYVGPDSRLTDWVRSQGGRASRFTEKDGDLATADGQRQLWNLLQRTQPRHVWMAPSSHAWCSWTSLNNARSPQAAQRTRKSQQDDLVHLRLCAKICEWQKNNQRHFHLEQPIASRMLSESVLQPVIAQTQRIVVDMCAFGFQTPVQKVPIRKRTVILSTSTSLVRSLVQKQCPGHPEHQPYTKRVRLLQGSSSQVGSYCSGFAKHVALQMLQNSIESALAIEGGMPMTRKRFKTSLGHAQPSSTLPAQKRASEALGETDLRSSVRQRLSSPPQASAQSPQSLPEEVWKPVFEAAAEHAVRASPSLVPPQNRLIDLLQAQLPQIRVLQVFAGKGCKQLHSPVGALPVPVAPWRVSLCLRQADGHPATYQHLGQEDRTTMSAESRRARIPQAAILLTLFAQDQIVSAPKPHPVSSDTSLGAPSTSSEPNLEGWGPPPIPIHGPAFRNLDKDLKARLIRAHNNLGHPAPKKLSEHLRAAGECQPLVEAALDYQCDVCLESTVPRHQRPSKLYEPKEFNDVLGVDGFFFRGQSGYRAYVVRILDEASCFHLGRRSGSRTGSEALQTLGECWFSWAGTPQQVYLDPAGEFRSEATLEAFQKQNIKTFVTAAAWQRGRIERHGDIVKTMLSRLDKEAPIINDALLDQALLQVFNAKNSLVRHKGYSPEQIVLGKSIRVPGSVSSDEELSSHSLTEGSDLEAEAHRRRLELRCRARQVFFEADNCQTIRRAGAWVLYWTKKTSPNRLAAGRWHGPAKVICQEGQSIVWVAHGSTILRCAPENLRPASLREWQNLASPGVEELSSRTGGASTFVDLTAPNPEVPSSGPVVSSNANSSGSGEVIAPIPMPAAPAAQGARDSEDEVAQPEQELTPQVSTQEPEPLTSREAPEVERDLAAPSVQGPSPGEPVELPHLDASNIPVPESDEGLFSEEVMLSSQVLDDKDFSPDELITFSSLVTNEEYSGPPLAEDNRAHEQTFSRCACFLYKLLLWCCLAFVVGAVRGAAFGCATSAVLSSLGFAGFFYMILFLIRWGCSARSTGRGGRQTQKFRRPGVGRRARLRRFLLRKAARVRQHRKEVGVAADRQALRRRIVAFCAVWRAGRRRGWNRKRRRLRDGRVSSLVLLGPRPKAEGVEVACAPQRRDGWTGRSWGPLLRCGSRLFGNAFVSGISCGKGWWQAAAGGCKGGL